VEIHAIEQKILLAFSSPSYWRKFWTKDLDIPKQLKFIKIGCVKAYL